MSSTPFIEREHELNQRAILRDTRAMSVRFGDWLCFPKNYAMSVATIGFAATVQPALATPAIVVLLGLHAWYSFQRHEMPLRYPKDLGGLDPSLQGNNKAAAGILFLGNERSSFAHKHNREIWVTNDDARTHMVSFGTTGSGKTQSLLGLCHNALCWGSGYFLADGKGANDLWVQHWSLMRRFGRDDDALLVNYLTGGRDPFDDMVKGFKTTSRSTNSMNVYAEGSADFLVQLTVSLLPKAEGDGKTWQDKAISMIDAVIRACCYLRAKGELEISIREIQRHITLEKLTELYLRGERQKDLPDEAYFPIKSYLETGIGFDPDKARKGKPQDPEVHNQHAYRTGQFSRTFAMLADTYGPIFAEKMSEVDMMDMMLNRRGLLVIIPTMEKSSQEAGSLGKLVVSNIRLMMARNLGDRAEGTYEELIANKPSKSETPSVIILDELGYYFAAGIDVMFAQARQLGIMMVSAAQDYAALSKGENKNEADTMIANTKIKSIMALEDPKDTYELVEKLAGETKISEIAGFQAGTNALTSWWSNMSNSGIEKVNRITLKELKALASGQSVLFFYDKIVRCTNFAPFMQIKETRAAPIRVNCFLQVLPVRLDEILPVTKTTEKTQNQLDFLLARMRGSVPIVYPESDYTDPVINGLHAFALGLPEKMPAPERGIALYMEAVRLMRNPVASEPDEPVVSGGGSVANKPVAPVNAAPDLAPPLPAATEPAISATVALAALPPEADEQFDALAFLDDPPIEEKPRSHIGSYATPGGEVAAASVAAAMEPVASTPGESREKWAEHVVDNAFNAPEAPVVSPAEPTAIGLKNDVMERLENIERLMGNQDPKDAVGGMEEEVAAALEFPAVADSGAISETDINNQFQSILSKLQTQRGK
jgi:intracellular multiplication protein IcmO